MMPNSVKDVRSLSVTGVKTDLAKLMTIWHDGSATEDGTAVTAATVTVVGGTTNTITLTINGSVDSRIGSSGVIDCENASYNTCAEVYAHINSVKGWHCRLEGVLGASVLSEGGRAIMVALSEASCYKYANRQTILRDSDVSLKAAGFEHGFVLSNRGNAPKAKYGKLRAIESERGYRIVLDYVSVTLTYAADSATIYVYKIKGTTETQIHQQTAAANGTAGTWTPTKPIVCEPDEHILVLAVNVSAVTACSVDIHGRAVKGAIVNL